MEPRNIAEILEDVREWPYQEEDNLRFTRMRQIWDEIWRRILYEQRMGHDSRSFDYICNEIKSIQYEKWFPNSPYTMRERGLHRSVLSTESWKYFDRTLRLSTFPETHLLCCVTYNGGQDCFVTKNYGRVHAEIHAIEYLKSLQLREVTMYVTHSPCAKCSDEISKFVTDQPDTFVKLNLRFSSVYQLYDEDTMYKLRELGSGNNRISLSVFSEEDWDNLEKHLVWDEEKKECKGTSMCENLKRKGETLNEEKQDSKKTKPGPEGEI